MKKSNLFLTAVTLILWITSSAQTGKPNPDTTRCYGITELQQISAGLVAGRTCDTLLTNCDNKLANEKALSLEKDFEIAKLNSLDDTNKSLITEREKTIESKNSEIKSKSRIIKWLKFGWGASVAVLTGVTTYFAFK
jgi:hypothetical protein